MTQPQQYASLSLQPNLNAGAPRSRRETLFCAGDFAGRSWSADRRIVHDAFLQRNDGIVGDVNFLGADFRAAFRDVAQADAELFLQQRGAVETPSSGCISSPAARTKKRGPPNCSFLSCSRRTWQTFWHRKHSMHLRNSCTRSTSCWIHLPLDAGARLERRNLFIHFVVPRNIGDQILDHRKGLHREHGDRLIERQANPCASCTSGAGLPFTSAEHEPHFAALQFQRTARSGA